MLSFKDWKSLNESYDVSMGLTTPASVGVVAPGYGGLSFEELLEAAKKKMKKKMMDDEGMDDEEDDDDAETGDGEVVEPSAVKDKEMPEDEEEDSEEEPEEDEDDEEEDSEEPEEKNPFLSNMKKKMKKMKKKMKEKMSSDKKSCDKMKKKMTAENSIETIETSNDPWLQSFKKMIANVDTRNDGITDYTNEDAIMPYIDINTGLTGERPEVLPTAEVPGQIGFAPQGKVGANFGN